MIHTISNFLSYFNPLSKTHHSLKLYEKLNEAQKSTTKLYTFIATFLTLPLLGVGGLAAFRYFTRKYTQLKIEEKATTPLEKTAQKGHEVAHRQPSPLCSHNTLPPQNSSTSPSPHQPPSSSDNPLEFFTSLASNIQNVKATAYTSVSDTISLGTESIKISLGEEKYGVISLKAKTPSGQEIGSVKVLIHQKRENGTYGVVEEPHVNLEPYTYYQQADQKEMAKVLFVKRLETETHLTHQMKEELANVLMQAAMEYSYSQGCEGRLVLGCPQKNAPYFYKIGMRATDVFSGYNNEILKRAARRLDWIHDLGLSKMCMPQLRILKWREIIRKNPILKTKEYLPEPDGRAVRFLNAFSEREHFHDFDTLEEIYEWVKVDPTTHLDLLEQLTKNYYPIDWGATLVAFMIKSPNPIQSNLSSMESAPDNPATQENNLKATLSPEEYTTERKRRKMWKKSLCEIDPLLLQRFSEKEWEESPQTLLKIDQWISTQANASESPQYYEFLDQFDPKDRLEAAQIMKTIPAQKIKEIPKNLPPKSDISSKCDSPTAD